MTLHEDRLLFDILTDDVKKAMKEHDNIARDCLRMVISDIKNATVNAGKEITVDACLDVLKKSVKTHNDSINQFNQAGRFDLADKEKAELEVIKKYIPKMISETQMQTIILMIIVENKIEEKKQNIGKVMKILKSMPISRQIDMKQAISYLNVLMK